MMGPEIGRVGRRTKLVLGSLAVGAAIGLIGRGLKRRRARIRRRKGFRTVALFDAEPRVQAEDAEWETLEGRALFKRLCVALTMAGYPSSDVGDIETCHQCETIVNGQRLFVTMSAGSRTGGRWVLSVTRGPGRGRRPGPAPVDTPDVRAFLGTLERALNDLGGVREVSFHSA